MNPTMNASNEPLQDLEVLFLDLFAIAGLKYDKAHVLAESTTSRVVEVIAIILDAKDTQKTNKDLSRFFDKYPEERVLNALHLATSMVMESTLKTLENSMNDEARKKIEGRLTQFMKMEENKK